MPLPGETDLQEERRMMIKPSEKMFESGLVYRGRSRYLIRAVKHILTDESNRGERFRRLMAFAGWQLWKRTVRKPVLVELFNGTRFLAYPDCQVSLEAICFHVGNFKEVAFLRRGLQGGILIDVGASVGLFTLSLADKVDQAILFEPNPLSAARAEENMAINGLDFSVQALAVSDQNGEILLEDQGGTNSNNRTLLERKQTSFPVRIVPRVTLDQFLEDHPFPMMKKISLIKIDVEGHENSVIRGMQRTLLRLRPDLLMFEYLQRTDARETQELLDEAGYRVYELREPKGLISLAGRMWPPFQNLFALPAETTSSLDPGATA